MTNMDFRTLAYSKSPKTTKRTTFQDELQAAVSARVNKTNTSHYSYYDDFEEDGDDFLNKLLKSRRNRTDTFKAAKSKSHSNTFELSDDESKDSRTKKVSFLKSQRTSSFSKDTTTPESQEKVKEDSSVSGQNDYSDSFCSTNASEDDPLLNNTDVEPPDPQILRQNSKTSLSYQTSDDTLLDLPLPLPSDSSVAGTPGPEEKRVSSQTPQLTSETDLTTSPGDARGREPPKPKPRQRTFGLGLRPADKPQEEPEFQSLSRPQTSSASIPFSNDTSSNVAVRSCSPQWTDGDRPGSCNLSKSPSYKSEHSHPTKSTVDSGSRDGFISDDSKDQEKNSPTSFEDLNEHSDNQSDQLPHVRENSSEAKSSSSHSRTTQRSQSACSRKVESKYLGSLKILDSKVSLQGSQPQGPDSLRAAIYQEWLEKKKEKSRDNLQLKKKEEIQKEKKKQAQESKKEDAVASYEAWKKKKAGDLKAKAKERENMIRKKQQATEEQEEKLQSAKQVFDKWKREHDHQLKEKYRKQKEAESKLQMKKQEKDEQRNQDSKSAFSDWCEKKKNVLHEKHTTKRKEMKDKTEEEQYMKEERDKMALEMYENWLARKDLEQTRQREERRIQSILRGSPPPPWSPPNKTIPFRK